MRVVRVVLVLVVGGNEDHSPRKVTLYVVVVAAVVVQSIMSRSRMRAAQPIVYGKPWIEIYLRI